MNAATPERSPSRHAILQVAWGPDALRKAVLAPGDRVTLGRSPDAALSFPDDPRVSSMHCEVEWTGSEIRVRDLGSIDGVRLDGERVTEATVPHGSYLQLGAVMVVALHEAGTPPGLAPSVSARDAAARAEALAVLAPVAAERALFGVFDAARDGRLLEVLREAIDDYLLLYDGVQGQALAEVAPYVVRFTPGSPLLTTCIHEGWGQAWGVYLQSGASLREVRRHLRRFLLAEEEETGRALYFRYYDPRVFRQFMPLATPRQQSEILNEIEAFFVEGEGAEVLRFGHEDARGDRARGR